MKVDWDDILAGDLCAKWDKLVSGLQGVQPFELERYYFKEQGRITFLQTLAV